MTTTSLKASTKAIKAPSEIETVLSSAIKLALSDITHNANVAFDLYVKNLDASTAYMNSEKGLSSGFYTWLTKTKPDYNTLNSVKKHIITSISETKGRAYATIEKWFNTNVMKAVKELGYELPKAESKNAESMAKKRAELAKIDNATLLKNITDLKQASDKASLKQALTLSTELEKRQTQAKNAIKKAEGLKETEYKNTLKKFITNLTSDELLVMMYVKNNFNEVAKLAKVN
jgi:hypothetical protein